MSGSNSVGSESWLPPGGTTKDQQMMRSVQIGAARGAMASENSSGVATTTAVESSNTVSSPSNVSDWQPPGPAPRTRYVDFTGRVKFTDNESSSDSSGHIPWVPNPDDISADGNEDREPPAPPSKRRMDLYAESDGEDDDEEDSSDDDEDTSSEYDSDAEFGTEYSSALRFEEEDDFVSNPRSNYDEEALQGGPRTLSALEEEEPFDEASSEILVRDHAARPRRMSPSRETSSGSIDSVLSYTGRISFQTEPEVITFEDEPNEERGTHYTRVGGSNRDRNKKQLSKSRRRSSSSGSGIGPDPVIYVLLSCIFVVIPAIVLTIVILFFNQQGGDNNESQEGVTFENSTSN
mmetsp:Transcript_165/g.322  ORF Transcript_165/g.322 Transcript_165/m.322 type:complete len:349 (+) Transcript_165:147-1193(+)